MGFMKRISRMLAVKLARPPQKFELAFELLGSYDTLLEKSAERILAMGGSKASEFVLKKGFPGCHSTNSRLRAYCHAIEKMEEIPDQALASKAYRDVQCVLQSRLQAGEAYNPAYATAIALIESMARLATPAAIELLADAAVQSSLEGACRAAEKALLGFKEEIVIAKLLPMLMADSGLFTRTRVANIFCYPVLSPPLIVKIPSGSKERLYAEVFSMVDWPDGYRKFRGDELVREYGSRAALPMAELLLGICAKGPSLRDPNWDDASVFCRKVLASLETVHDMTIVDLLLRARKIVDKKFNSVGTAPYHNLVQALDAFLARSCKENEDRSK
jgi:hypothetical protein